MPEIYNGPIAKEISDIVDDFYTMQAIYRTKENLKKHLTKYLYVSKKRTTDDNNQAS